MPSGHYKKVIDPRTRAEVSPEVVPFWHLKIAAGPGSSDNVEDPQNYRQLEEENGDNAHKENGDEGCLTLLNSLKYLDGCSAFLSLVAGVLAIVLLDFGFDLWQEETVFVKATDPLIESHNTYQNAVTTLTGSPTAGQGSCLNDWELTKACIDYTKLNEDTGVLVWAIPHTINANKSLELMPMILFVVWFSAIVQGLRCCLNPKNIFGCSSRSFEYNPVKPDFWRWFEYACTSPLQIVLVGLSVMIGNWVQLLLLATLQLALIWFGFVIEKRINKLYKSEKSINFVKLLKVWILFGCAVYCHWVIWNILFFHVNSHDSNLQSCKVRDEGDGLPSEVMAVIRGQLGCFSLFGFVQFVQLLVASRCYMYKHENNSCYNEEARKKNWLKVTFAYSVLSVAAKLTLDITLIYFVDMSKKVKCDGA